MLAPSSSSCSVSLVCAIPLGVWLRTEEIAWKSHQPISNSLLNCCFRLCEFVLSLQLWNNNSVFHRELVLPGQKALVAPLGTFPRFGLDFPLRLSEEAFSSVETSVAHCWLPLLSCRLPGASPGWQQLRLLDTRAEAKRKPVGREEQCSSALLHTSPSRCSAALQLGNKSAGNVNIIYHEESTCLGFPQHWVLLF